MKLCRASILLLLTALLTPPRPISGFSLSIFTFPDLTSIAQVARHRKSPPKYPSSYQVSYNFSLPYESTYLADGLSIPVKIWKDAPGQKIRIDTLNGVNSLIATKEVSYEIFPKKYETSCAKVKPDPGEVGPLSREVLPDVRKWKYVGKAEINRLSVHVWEYSRRHGDKHTVYRWYADEDDKPVRLHMHGNDAFSGAHFDVWIVDYYDYKPGVPEDSDVFDVPEVCDKTRGPSEELSSFSAQIQSLLPTIRAEETVSRTERILQKQAAFFENAALVEAHNQDSSKSYRLELNRFADWSQDEFEAIMLPRHKQPRGLVTGSGKHSGELPYERLAPKGALPRTVDWSHSLADFVVKDQAACGSCWAFATTGTMEAAHYLATGEKKLFSEQQLMDCSWGHGLNKGCDGGDYDAAMDYLKELGGIIEEGKGEYLGADAFCRDRNVSLDLLTDFEGFAYIPQYNDEALMEAVYSRGPIAVSLDASVHGFRFYSEGILDSSNCKWKSEELDHAVLLVGYGTCPMTGKDYWLIRNSWSTYWGDNGYVKIERANHGCGIATDPVYAVFKSSRSSRNS